AAGSSDEAQQLAALLVQRGPSDQSLLGLVESLASLGEALILQVDEASAVLSERDVTGNAGLVSMENALHRRIKAASRRQTLREKAGKDQEEKESFCSNASILYQLCGPREST